MSKVAINREVLQWALDRSNQTAEGLAHSLPEIGQWLEGVSQPTLRQLEKLARVTLTPFGFLLLDKPPEERLPIPHYRTLADNAVDRPSPDLLETIRSMQRRQAWMREYVIEEGQAPRTYVNSAEMTEKPTAIAARIRATLAFQDNWAEHEPNWSEAARKLREAIDHLGILVVVNGIVGNNTHRKLDPKEFRGFVLVDQYVPLMFVNGADGKAAQMFSLAHELAHIFLGSSAAFDLRDMLPAQAKIEQLCNQVAAEFLVPELRLRNIWRKAQAEPEPYQYLARYFKVSELVVARRALDLGLISRVSFFAFYEAYQADERRDAKRPQSGGNFYAVQGLRVGNRLATTVIRAVKEGRLLYSEAYALTGLHGRTFQEFAAQVYGERV